MQETTPHLKDNTFRLSYSELPKELIYHMGFFLASFAPSPVVSIYKTLEIEFFAIKNLINIFLTYYNLYKFASAIGPFRADTFKKFSPNDSR